MTADARLTLPAHGLDTADSRTAEVLEKARRAVGFIPNMYAGMVNSPGLLETYLDGYARFRAESGFTPVEQEVVFLVISRLNGCDYCMAAHSMIAEKKSGVPAPVLAALRSGESLPDAKLDALATFTAVLFETRGLPDRAALAAFLDAGYSQAQVLEIVLALAVKTLSNYANHMLHTEIDQAFAGHAIDKAA